MESENIVSGLTSELRRGTLVLGVLSSLSSPTYGYSLIGELNERGVEVEANTLYPLLRRLEKQGLLKSEWEVSGAKPRKYYETTEQGEQVCRELRLRWEETVTGMETLLSGQNRSDA